MKTTENKNSASQRDSDFKAVIDAIVSGKPVPADVASRVQAQADKVQQNMQTLPANFGVDVIREMRGPVDEEQERLLTLAQRDILHFGDRKLLDPDTGEMYVLVPEAEYQRLAAK